MNVWVAVFLFLHVLGAIAAFGPAFSAPIIGSMAGKEPQHANFAARINHAISVERIRPLALFQGVTGVALIIVAGFDLLNTHWLLLGIVLYLIAISYALFVQIPVGERVVELSSAPPPAGASGPPPELGAAVLKAQRGGMLLGLLIVVIVFLMVVKPQF